MPLERAGGQAQFIVHETPVDDHTSMGQLLTWIERNLRSNLSLPVLRIYTPFSQAWPGVSRTGAPGTRLLA
jgi:hypothetical protein